MSMEVSLSLEETNKLRVSLGLKPIKDDGVPTGGEADAERNFAKRREEEAKTREAKAIQDRIAKVRNKQELNASLKGKTLADVDDNELGTLQWVKKTKRKEKEMAKKRQEEIENMDKVFQGEEYTEKDLVGLKVSHDFEALEEGEAHILTLKDSRILDNEEDELQDISVAEEDRRKKNMELKTKKRDYTGYDDDEFVSGNAGMKRAVLAKYDEELLGPKESGFRLGASTAVRKNVRTEQEQAAATVNKSLLSIDYAKNLESSDYLQEGDVGFKKLKKKKRSPRRVPEFSDIPPAEESMDVDVNPSVPRTRNLDINFVDDDELQAALARSRQAKLLKPKKISPEEVAKKIAIERVREAEAAANGIKVEADDDAGDADGSGLTFDDTSEFVRGISYNPAPIKTEPIDVVTPTGRHWDRHSTPNGDQSMPVDEAIDELEAGELVMKDEDEEAMLNAIENAIKVAEAEESAAQAQPDVGTSSEQTFNTGMASTLNILRQQGILATPSADQKERERVQLQRDFWLADQRRRVAQRELERLSSRGVNKDQATREYENRLREQQEARENLETFKNYKPDVNIVYYDEFGRTLTPKEAWKALSHKFHGKGSGKMKTEKRLKKIAEEKKKEAMATGDTPLSMNKAFQIRQEKTRQAHFVLSVGNRGAVPQAAEFFDPQPLSKGKTERTKSKKKDAVKARASTNDSGFMTLPAPQTAAAISAVSTPKSESPAPSVKPGFSRISSAMASASVSQDGGGTPISGETTKLVFGFGTKRKAEDEAQESPPKRR